MSAHPDVEQLEAEPLAPDVAGHVAQCAECAREVAWLRAERTLVTRRPMPPVDHLWGAVEAAVKRPQASGLGRRRPHWARRAAISAAAVAAGLAVFFLRAKPAAHVVTPVAQQQQPVEDRVDPKALAALDKAEASYREATTVLEAEYAKLRPRLDPKLAKKWDETLTRAHTDLGEARAVAGEDVNARMQVLDGYAGYLRSLRSVVQSAEEANP